MNDTNEKMKDFKQSYRLFEIVDGERKIVGKVDDSAGIKNMMLLLALMKARQFEFEVVYSAQYNGTGEEILRKLHSKKG